VPCRPPAQSLLFTAIAATVVILPWALNGLPGAHTDRVVTAAATELSQQPLTGVGGGVTVREVSQSTPFSLVALTADDLTGTTAKVRAKRPDGSWGPWYTAYTVETGRADSAPPHGPRGTEPIFVGRTTSVQIAITRPAVAGPPPVAAKVAKNAKPPLGYVPAAVERPLGQDINAVLISPPQGPVDPHWVPPDAVSAPGQPPQIISRAQWGADESIRCGTPVYDNGIKAGIVHHTAGSNDYSPQDSAEIVRAIYAYHTRTLGWCDIGYNALVDKYGQVFEGHAGGITKPVQGVHTGGFNSNTWAVAMMGDFEVVPPTPVQVRTVGRLLGWRLAMDHVNPEGRVTLISAGGPYTFVPAGAPATLPAIFTHRDVGNTACPGDAAYAQMGKIRDIAARFNEPPNADDLAQALEGGAIAAKWHSMGGMTGTVGAPTSAEKQGAGPTRYATFVNGSIYWSPKTGAEPVLGAIRDEWAALGYERSPLGLPTSAEIHEPEWIVQNFQHGTLNFDPVDGRVTKVIDGVAELLPPAPPVIVVPIGQAPIRMQRGG
jgi:uncharacterized protein with LGFP repeats